MAKADVVYKEVEKLVKQKVQDGVVLTLTNEEAEVLYLVSGNITGPIDGPRGKMNNIYNVLEKISGLDKSKYRNDNTMWISNKY